MTEKHKNKIINKIVQHLDFSYYQTNYSAKDSPLNTAQFKGIEIVITGLDALLQK